MKKWSLLIAALMLWGLSTIAHAGEIPSSYDFEDYTGGMPSGWSGNSTYMNSVTVDEEHGTSLDLHNVGADIRPVLSYTVPTVSEGKFLINFDIASHDTNKNFRITLESPSNGQVWHSIFYMNTSGELCAWMNTSNGAWEPKKMISFDLDTWYNVGILIDMDNKKIDYYVDGEFYVSSDVAFDDISTIFFRTENGIEDTEGHTYIDNASFKYVTADGMCVLLDNEVVNSDDDTVSVKFSDLITPVTLNKLKAYSMGNNPLEYTKEAVECSLVDYDNSKAKIKFENGLEENTIYKIDFPGLTSLYGDAYQSTSVYFVTNKPVEDRPVVNADFSTAEIGSSIIPATDAEWTASSSYVRIAVVNDLDEEGSDINAVRFSRRNSEVSVERTFDVAYERRVVLEYKMKSETPTQVFKIYDSYGAELDFVTVKPEGIYYGENKLSDYTPEWFTVTIELKQSEKKAVFSINNEEKGEYSYSGIEDLKAVKFIQKNLTGASGADRAKTDIAYFTAVAAMPKAGINLVKFEDTDGNTYYPDDSMAAKLSKVIIGFSDSMKASSFENGIKLITGNNEEEYTGEYNAITKQYVMSLPQYLEGNSTYTIVIDGVLDVVGTPIDSVSGDFVTKTGSFECEVFDMELAGQNVILDAEITHTNSCYDDTYLIYAAYQDDFMIDFKATRIAPQAGERKLSVHKVYAVPEGAEKVSAFLWDGFDTRNPFSKAKTIERE